MRKYYIEEFGLTETEVQAILQCYNGADPVPGLAPYRDVLQVLHDTVEDGNATMTELVAAGHVVGDVADNETKLAAWRDDAAALLRKVEGLTVEQVAVIQGYAVGYWAGHRDAA
jgi:hypothetical protein